MKKNIIKKMGLHIFLFEIYNIFVNKILANVLSDKPFISLVYFLNFRRKINLTPPKSFNEKLNWLKLYDHNPVYKSLADKYEVKNFVSQVIGEKYVVPCYGVWDSSDEIDFNNLPKQFVLKTTHNSSGVFVCRDKELLDMEKIKEELNKSLKRKYYKHTREWVYKEIAPRIIADEYLDDGSGHELKDYKFWCFNGEPRMMYITNKGKEIFENFYDMDFNVLNINHGFPRRFPEYEKPECFEEMKVLARQLSSNIPFVRIDFFYVNKRIYFGEFTFYDWAGLRPFKKYEMDCELGKFISIK